jgi:hypothetical protein
VLSPGEFDRASLMPSAPASERIAFPSASAVPLSALPFTNIAFQGDQETYTKTPVLLQTIIAIATPTAGAGNTTSAPTGSSTPTPTGQPQEFAGAGNGLFPAAAMALPIAMGAAVALF